MAVAPGDCLGPPEILWSLAAAVQAIAVSSDGESYAYAAKRQRSWLFLATPAK